MKRKNSQGQSFIELIAALVVVSIVLTAIVGLITKSIANATAARNKTLATSYAQEGLEWLRAERDLGWTAFYGRTNNSWCIVSLSWTTGGSHSGACSNSNVIAGTQFVRTLTFANRTASSVDARMTVSWRDGSGTHESTATTIFTNWKGNP